MCCGAGLGFPLGLKKRKGFCYVFLRFGGECCCGVIARLLFLGIGIGDFDVTCLVGEERG